MVLPIAVVPVLATAVVAPQRYPVEVCLDGGGAVITLSSSCYRVLETSLSDS
jgi:hypothetical protein